ncbi:MAG: carotenoid oxygenase family protein [Deltaproteobacteria bacterium]
MQQDKINAWAEAAWRPSSDELTYRISRIEGEVPREIHGSYYRNGPSQHILPEGGARALHLFDGDGLVHAFRFDDGRVDYTGRFVRDPSFLIEEEEGRFCMNSVGVTVDNPTDRMPIRQQHNTNIVYHGGKLMALVENAWPFQLNPRTLEAEGETDFGVPRLGMSVSAHPHIDGRSGQMIVHGYQPFEPYYQIYIVEPDGRASLSEAVDAPYAVMMHDVAITENYIILLLCPMTFNGRTLLEGGGFEQAIAWEPELGLKFGVYPRTGGSPRWFEAPTPGFIFHTGNAYEEDGKIFMDACTYGNGTALLRSIKDFRSGETDDAGATPYLYELDLASGDCRETRLSDRGAEFPRIDDRLGGYKNRFGYALVAGDNALVPGTGTVCRYDRSGGPSSYYDFGLGQMPGEPVFVPRSADSAEDDGFVVTVVYDAPNDGNYLAILDAGHLASGPLARAHLEHRIPMGFHGNFYAGLV